MNRNKLLIVDDVPMNREILSMILEEHFEEIIQAENGEQALDIIKTYKEELCCVLLDLTMPVIDGFEVLKRLKDSRFSEHVPILIISAETAVDKERACFDYGVVDFIRKPFDGKLVYRRVFNATELFNYRAELEECVEEQTKILKKQNIELNEKNRMLKKANENVIDILGSVVESRSLESGNHIKRVKCYTEILAKYVAKDFPEYGLTSEKIKMITTASSLHDVGKISIPDKVLNKPGKLTDEEFELMKKHTIYGCEMLDNIREYWEKESVELSYEICRYHHERFDGKGYPEGLAGDDIPISAQLVSVADVYDALVNDRCYRKALPKDTAFNMIINGECGNFNPKIIKCFIKAREEFEQVMC